MNKTVLKYMIYISGIICLYAFISIRFESMFNGVLTEKVVNNYWDKTKYGELYYFSHILHFREKGLPPAKRKFEYSEKQATVNSCDILTFGDSFFKFSRHKQFPERLADDFHKKVHYVNNDHPLDYLAATHYSGMKPKLMIFERVERYIPITFDNEHIEPQAVKENSSRLKNSFEYIIEKIFYPRSEELYDVMLKRSFLTTYFYSVISTIKFDLFGYISKMTPKYLNDGDNSWLFYYDQIDENKTSFYYHHSKAEMDSICDNMANLAQQLKKKYNICVIYLPLPAKYTLYHKYLNNDPYNNFLPQLYEGLNKRGVHYVNVYDDFMTSDTLLYYHTDSHWNEKGITIAYSQTLEYLKSDSCLRKYLY